ncbi:MAG: RNA polymerase sigma factor [Candidatus Nealsonbacteria bacterium]|nr:RNA polymerase sigma factor [Candidatus Nealsonbacteria bacterium]
MANKRKEFSKIYDRCINKIYRFIFLKVNSEEIAQDLCSETFLKGWESYKNNPNIENPSAFLYRIARNLTTDYYREKGRTNFVSPEIVPIVDPKPGIEEKVVFNSDLDQVKLVLADLKEDYQNVIIWHYLDDLPIPKVAKMLDKSEGATRVTLHRALKSIKNEINRREVKEG